MGFVDLPARSTLIRVHEPGFSILVSPLPTMTVESMRELGQVDLIIAPNLFHHMGLSRAVRAWPSAELWGPVGLQKKRPDLHFSRLIDAHQSHSLTDRGSLDWPLKNWIEIIPIQGIDRFQEWVFYIPSLKTLICTDLVFNLTSVRGFRAKAVFGLFGTYRRLAVSRLLRFLVNDSLKLSRSIDLLLGLEIEKVIMAHGEVIDCEGGARLRVALEKLKR